MNRLVLLLIIIAYSLTAQPEPVKVEEGLLQGTLENEIVVYRGVPYAAAPVGNLRWKAPQSPVHWDGIRMADKFSANPVQVMVKEYGPWTSEYQPKGEISEDCLYLNIWTPAVSDNKKLPVLMYIPGGAFTGGSGNVPVYNGKGLAKKGIIVVTINYRVGVFGFLAHPALTEESTNNSSGNYGLLDQLAALKWLKKNIAAFGGDPDQITIMGQSAGAASVNYLLASPLAKGMFARAIAMSGTRYSNSPGENLTSAEKKGVKFAMSIGASSLSELRSLSSEKLMELTKESPRFYPIVDGWYLPEGVDQIFADGKQNDVVTMTGWTADEGSYSDNYGKVSADEFKERLKSEAGKMADKILELYPANNEEETMESQKSFARDNSLVSTYLWTLKRAETSGTDIYTYIFTHQQPGETKDKFLAFHSSELPYVFNSLNQAPRPWTKEDSLLANKTSDYWVNFIKSGNPNGQELPKWEPVNNSSPETMEIGDKVGMRPLISEQKFEVMKNLIN